MPQGVRWQLALLPQGSAAMTPHLDVETSQGEHNVCQTYSAASWRAVFMACVTAASIWRRRRRRRKVARVNLKLQTAARRDLLPLTRPSLAGAKDEYTHLQTR